MAPPSAWPVRIARAAGTLAVAFLTCFLLLRALPGDPLDRLDDPRVPAEQAERNRRALGLDRPLAGQLLQTLASWARGDLGVSFTRRRPVAAVLAEALPYTLLLGGATLVAGYAAGLALALGLVALGPRARRRGETALLALATIPRFWLGVMLVMLLHGLAGWFPASHAHAPGGGGLADLGRHLVLPWLTLALPTAATVGRFLLAHMERALAEPHVLAARASGAGTAALLGRHVLRPSLAPAAALVGVDLPVLVSGAVVVEVVFAWPGAGRLAADAVLGADYPLALACTGLAAATVVAGRQLAETAAARLDPRSDPGPAAVR